MEVLLLSLSSVKVFVCVKVRGTTTASDVE